MNYNTDNPKFHEEVFNEVADVTQECYNYLNDEEADKLNVIYAIGSMEIDWISFNVFFQIQNKLLKKHQIKDKDNFESQDAISEYGIEFLRRLKNIFKSYDQPAPTQIKIQFFAESEEVKYNFEYDLLWSNKEDLLSSDLHNKWFDEIKSNLGNEV